MEKLNGETINIGKEFPTVFSSKAKKPQVKDDILKKTNKKIDNGDFRGNVVIMVNKKSKKGRKRGKKRGKKAAFEPIKTEETPVKPEVPQNPKPVQMKGLNPSKTTDNKHRRWNQYYESLFFISHVSRAIKKRN